MSNPRRELWSLTFFCKCSVSRLILSVSKAICTSAEPVSLSWSRNPSTIFDLASISLVNIYIQQVQPSFRQGRCKGDFLNVFGPQALLSSRSSPAFGDTFADTG